MPRPRAMALRDPVGEGRDAVPGVLLEGGFGERGGGEVPSVRTGL